ncbi:choice-of-anchor H family protein [Shewanella sp. M16]|uniref:choice-of-anchor H family protein n=1 Tax=unclassified Shewanella TaxID=196818 RepID=UPI001BAFC860|nr:MULTISPECIES: choice-of-anchor H family protein [unclassified Shewanella]MBS0041072.1 choice-of-anchor H family protein [Shewanella sp. M16]MBW3517140.1 choice-of-anchor H family protein [Shewanella sp. NKUCC01_JLK]
MNTLNKQDMAATVNIKLFMATAIAALFLASPAASAQPRELESSQSLTPFTAASVGIAKKAENSEQAAEQEQQALALLQQAAPAKNVTEVAAAAVKSLAPALSSKAPTVNRVQLMGASPMTREQVTAKHASQGIPSSSATSEDPYRAPVYHSFSIFDASSRLFEDFDYDGFYQTFSVTFDVDVNGSYLNERADLFAELYLSRDGGPWVHYYTTDVFTIYGDSTQDDYEVLTTLYTGYATDHYDVLIDVYEVGYSDIVATISADETDSLYALPLESSDRDREPDIIVVEESGGAFSVLGLLCLSLCAGLRLNRTRA